MIEAFYELFLSRYNYWMAIILMLIGLYALIAKQNLVKKLIGLNIFQTAIFLFYISFAEVQGGTAPIYLPEGVDALYVNPLPHVLILTAIVVGVSVTAVGLSLIVRIYEEYGVIDEDDLMQVVRGR
ncbi:cation:proton antiporter subunit C [Methanoculleus sp. YWC-01]|jgi:multicomponent Na+:H+ antiporter subunit C|uniref:Cation:proton antiporter subunit C n=1 Tax=Methanoculleus nereidis TaxID=2735141 RepID=A0ABU3Z3W7_9EURY|nr:cation:proton antiporter subunit C [Methanoculleus sp. YWC-01]MCK9298716.1 cation:proton antiporter subunit C [Methanoculleus sp.]MDV4343506.1 cation:proton antiporter subunit C [Methanoculleus sp. YWC-01]